MTLIEVIDRARTEWCIQHIEAWRKPDAPQPPQSDHIASAVARHLLSDAVVERAAIALYERFSADECREVEERYARAALEGAYFLPWHSITEDVREAWRANARVALKAASGDS